MAFSEYKEIIKSWFDNQDNLEVKAMRFKKILEYLTEIDETNSISNSIAQNNKILYESIDKVKNSNQEISLKIEEMEALISENQSILNLQTELNSQFDNLLNTKKIIEDLKNKKKEIEKPENAIDDLNDEIIRINENINAKLNDYIIQLNALNSILENSKSELEQKTNQIINQAVANIEAITNKQYSIIEKLSNEPIKTIYDTFDERIANLTSEYNVYVEKIESIKNDLESVEKNHSTIVESFMFHELENERVYGNLRKIGEMDGVNVYFETLSREIKEKLTNFDNNIKKLIDKKRELPLYERI